MAGSGGRAGGFRRGANGKMSKATGRGREAKAAYKYGRGRMRANRPGGFAQTG